MFYIFWLSILLPLYAVLGYPLLLRLISLSYRQPVYARPERLTVSVIVALHNEEDHVAAKIDSILRQSNQPDRLQIIFASDGSTDQTVQRARACVDERIQVLDLPRAGKIAVLNEAVRHAQNDILVFTDADNQWLDGCLEHLLRPFSDPAVGCTAGNMQVVKAGRALGLGDRLYRVYESWLRATENKCGCMVSADGALLALRRELYQPIPAHVNDDFFISTCALVQDKKIIYVEQARVLDTGVDEIGKQYRRRIRVTVGGLNSLAARRALFNPIRYGVYALALFSHKLIRRLSPLFLLPLLLSNFFLVQRGIGYELFLYLQLAGYGVALLGLVGHRRKPKLVRLAGFVLITLVGMLVGCLEFMLGKKYGQWNPQQNR